MSKMCVYVQGRSELNVQEPGIKELQQEINKGPGWVMELSTIDWLNLNFVLKLKVNHFLMC